MHAIDQVIQKFTYGHYIVTALKPGDELKTREKDYIAAGTVNWLTQLSFEPPMIGVAIGQKSDLNETIDYSQHFTVHLLGPDQKGWIERFSGDSKIEDGRINGVPFEKQDHALILEDTLGYLICKLEKSTNTGDHTLHIGQVIKATLFNEDQAPICTKDQAPKYTQAAAETH
ncbi:flavin reductase family protein [Flavilitoribacter nigricans]|uniref:Flavin reductase n=1 Tax=Flavilitoribacter nigricans (strain ATCC 23147 / DSM 23189 / NBRC 102662 / NCIMB 1420 / SS-2) TaxID=1122177 RepID=A0A2D0NDU0_FLAN2|nr:flavin reductase family protein [Flavilitoribacter nigricans]PHN06540.1 flavin reductase [Flavilitoribacter nigricans DSM 23189 = NBRC 102662]